MTSSDYIAIAGVAANLMVVLVALLVPMWQRRAMLNDAKEAKRQAWGRFIEAFAAVADAQDAVVTASVAQYPAAAFAEVEPRLQRAVEALARASATELPVAAALNAIAAQQMAAAILTHFPELKVYGRNLLTDSFIEAQILRGQAETSRLLAATEALAEI